VAEPASTPPPAHTMAYVRDQATAELMHLQNAIRMELLARGVPVNQGSIATLQLPDEPPMNERPSSVSSTGAKSSSCSGSSSSSSKSIDGKLEDEEQNRKPKAQQPGEGDSNALAEAPAAAEAAPDVHKSSSSSESSTTTRSSHNAREALQPHPKNKKRRTSHHPA
jgi:hypothetical protein